MRELTQDEKLAFATQLQKMIEALKGRLPMTEEKMALLMNLRQANYWLQAASTSFTVLD